MVDGRRTRVSRLTRLLESEKALAATLLAPGVAILAIFIAYPFVMALWYSLTSIRVGDPGEFIGLANFSKAIHDSIFQMAFKNTVKGYLTNPAYVIDFTTITVE